MYSWKHVACGLGIAAVMILSSVPLVRLDAESGEPASDFCTAKHGKHEAECKADKEHHCVWCVSRAVSPMCFDEESAKQLPPSVFKCDFNTLVTEESHLETV